MGNHRCIHNVEEILEQGRDKEIMVLPGPEDEAHIVRMFNEHNVNVDGRIVNVNGINLAGIGGVDPATSIGKLRKLVEAGSNIDILVSHYPPSQIDGILLRGSLGIFEIVKISKTRIILFLTEEDSLMMAGYFEKRQYIIVGLEDYHNWTVIMEIEGRNEKGISIRLKKSRGVS